MGILSAMTAPVWVGNKIIGVLNVGMKETNGYTAEHERLMIQITSLLSTTIENRSLLRQMEKTVAETKRAEAALERQAERLNKLNALIVGLSQARTSKEAFQIFATETKEITNTERVSVALLNEAGMLEVFALDGDAGALPTGMSLPIEGTMIGAVVKEQKPIFLSDTSDSSWLDVQQLHKMGLRAMLDVPLITAGKVIGTLNTGSKTVDSYGVDSESLLLQIASMFATTLENKQLLEKTKEAKEAAEVASRAKSYFLSNMSHELRTPLNGILGYAQILKRNSNLTDDQSNGLDIIYQSGDHLLTLINDILDLSKIEAGKIELYPTTLRLEHFLGNVIDIIRMRAAEKKVSFVYRVENKLPASVIVDERCLRQILINLLGNAVKFTKQGYVTLRVKGLNDALLQKDQVKLRFEVIDTGVGIAPEHLKKIFLPFEQVGDAKQRAKGTGLGLAITCQLLSLMGSHIQVKSELGHGSTFCFDLTLPVVEFEIGEGYVMQKRASDLSQVIGYRGPTKTLLVADDQPENRLMLRDMLQPFGFKIIEAKNGQEEVDLARQQAPDLILTDLLMPIMNGFEAVKQIRQFLPDVPIIAISANVFDIDQQKSRLAGCNAFLPKPVEQQNLLTLISQHLSLAWVCSTNRDDSTKEKMRVDHSTDRILHVTPPAQELEILYELTSLGKMSAIRKQMAYLEQLDIRFVPFIRQLRQLVRKFDDDKIFALLDRALAEKKSVS